MKAKCHFVKVDCLASRIGKKVPVDMVGIVTDVGSIGSIKRQHDGTEFVRRYAMCSCNFGLSSIRYSQYHELTVFSFHEGRISYVDSSGC